MAQFFLTVARLAAAAWVGAALLFVVTAVQEATSPQLSSATKSLLADLRFPWYYGFGFGLVGAAFAAAAMAGLLGKSNRRRLLLSAGLLLLCLAVMTADFLAIYRPLLAMNALPPGERPAEFATYHRLSMIVNAVGVMLDCLAALVLCWPVVNASDKNV